MVVFAYDKSVDKRKGKTDSYEHLVEVQINWTVVQQETNHRLPFEIGNLYLPLLDLEIDEERRRIKDGKRTDLSDLDDRGDCCGREEKGKGKKALRVMDKIIRDFIEEHDFKTNKALKNISWESLYSPFIDFQIHRAFCCKFLADVMGRYRCGTYDGKELYTCLPCFYEEDEQKRKEVSFKHYLHLNMHFLEFHAGNDGDLIEKSIQLGPYYRRVDDTIAVLVANGLLLMQPGNKFKNEQKKKSLDEGRQEVQKLYEKRAFNEWIQQVGFPGLPPTRAAVNEETDVKKKIQPWLDAARQKKEAKAAVMTTTAASQFAENSETAAHSSTDDRTNHLLPNEIDETERNTEFGHQCNQKMEALRCKNKSAYDGTMSMILKMLDSALSPPDQEHQAGLPNTNPIDDTSNHDAQPTEPLVRKESQSGQKAQVEYGKLIREDEIVSFKVPGVQWMKEVGKQLLGFVDKEDEPKRPDGFKSMKTQVFRSTVPPSSAKYTTEVDGISAADSLMAALSDYATGTPKYGDHLWESICDFVLDNPAHYFDFGGKDMRIKGSQTTSLEIQAAADFLKAHIFVCSVNPGGRQCRWKYYIARDGLLKPGMCIYLVDDCGFFTPLYVWKYDDEDIFEEEERHTGPPQKKRRT